MCMYSSNTGKDTSGPEYEQGQMHKDLQHVCCVLSEPDQCDKILCVSVLPDRAAGCFRLILLQSKLFDITA